MEKVPSLQREAMRYVSLPTLTEYLGIRGTESADAAWLLGIMRTMNKDQLTKVSLHDLIIQRS